MTINEIKDIISHYEWLCEIKSSYKKHIELIQKERDHFTVEGILYSASGDIRKLDINCHKPISPDIILMGLKDAVSKLDTEIRECVEKLRQIGVMG